MAFEGPGRGAAQIAPFAGPCPNRAALRLPAAASLHGEKRGGERALGLQAQGALIEVTKKYRALSKMLKDTEEFGLAI